MISPWLIYAPALAIVGLAARAWTGYRFNVRKRREAELPLVDLFLLELVFSPRKINPDDDEAVLDEMKRIIARVNERSRSTEFEAADSELAQYYGQLAQFTASRPTARRAIIRLIESGDKPLQILGARVAAQLRLPEADAPLRRLIDSLPNETGTGQGHERSSELLQALHIIGEPRLGYPLGGAPV